MRRISRRGIQPAGLVPAGLVFGMLAAAAAPAAAQQAVESSRRTAIVRAAERVGPAVVGVHVVRRERAQPRSLYESMFMPPGAQREVAGLGSGFIVDAEGLVVTNEHVVRGADQVLVTLADGRELSAEVVGTDEVTDLALLRVDAGGPDLPVAPLGASDDLIIGEWVIAIGNPIGYLLSNPEPTVTAGVVSGVGRNIIPSGEDRGFYLDMIQTDASINPGNSGGPLINAAGEVVGVNSSIFSRSGGSEGLGFAIPIDRAMRVVRDLADDGRVRRAWIGADVEAADPNRWGRSSTVRVASVAPGSPAEAAGLRAGDIVVRLGRRAVRTPLDWEAALLDMRPGTGAALVVHRGGQERTFDVRPGDLPSLTAARVQALAGFELVTLTPAIRAERGLTSERGALIVALPETAARDLGLRAGDLIVQINRVPIDSAEDAARVLRAVAGRGGVRLFFEREGRLMSRAFHVR